MKHILIRSCLAIIVSISGLPISIYAQTDTETEYLNALERTADIEKRGTSLFAIPTPGETFNELTGDIGHSVVDMEMSGNGLLGFKLQRDFEHRPAQYPYDLATMSVRVPHIKFSVSDGVIPALATCAYLESKDGKVFNDIQFKHESGNVSLINKERVQPNVLSLFSGVFTSKKTEFISKDNWLLDCVGDEYRIRSPNGLSYYFNAHGAESFEQKRYVYNNSSNSTPSQRSVRDFMNYKIYASRIERLNSQVIFVYTQAPSHTNDPTVTNPYSVELNGDGLEYRVRPPLHFEPGISSANIYSGLLLNKRRLVRVELRAGDELATSSATENQFMYFSYRPENGECPGLLHSVHSETTKLSKVVYGYDHVQEKDRSIGAPHSRCVLNEVLHDPSETTSNNDQYRAWSFEYGAVGSETSYYYPTAAVRDRWADYIHRSDFLPLHSVTTPTGAKTTYEYTNGTTCDYQDTHNAHYTNELIDCGKETELVPLVNKRTITGGDILTQVTDMEYTREDTDYKVVRVIQDEESMHRLEFGRINRSEVPTEQLSDTHVKSGKLLSYQLFDVENDSSALVNTNHYYQEGLRFPIDISLETSWEKTANNFASWHDHQRIYLLDSRRVNLINTLTTIDGIQYETKYNAYDAFNNLTQVAEVHRINNVSEQRNIAMSYDNNHILSPVYFVSALATKQTTSGESYPLVDKYVYDSAGLLASKTIAGFKTGYSYHANGEIKRVIDGLNKYEERTWYKRGVPRLVSDRDLKDTTRTVDDFGNITEEKDPSKVKQTYSYNDIYKRITAININTSGNKYKDTDISHAQFNNDNVGSTYKITRETVSEKYRKTTRYDSLGRVYYIVEQDFTGPTVNRIQRFAYDRQGRLRFKGAVRSDWSVLYGTHYEYDHYGRIKYVRYPLISSPAIEYCHGPNCSGNFATAGAVKDGYAVRDQLGYVTVHNHRAYGSPANKELVEIRQEIRPDAWSSEEPDTDDDVVVTTINRNKVGFISSVNQKGDSGSGFTRTYVPHAAAGSTTFLIKEEKHPEFADKKSYLYDQNGNVTKVTNYNGAQTIYIYDSMDRLRYAQNPAAMGSTAAVSTTEHRYNSNGTLSDTIQGNRAWNYKYNDINLLEEEKLTIDSESFLIKYKHDDYAQVEDIVYPGGRTVSYEKSGFGQAKSVSGFATDITYHANGMTSAINFDNGTKFTSTQDSYQRPQIWRTEDSNADAYFNFGYEYDDRSNITDINNYFPPNGGSLTNLQYDGLNRLTRAEAAGVWGVARFSYDPIGNIRKKDVGGNNRNYSYSTSSNRLTVASSNQALSNYAILSYDDNGNITSHSLADYQFDQLNRLVKSDDGTAVLDNTYDGHNMRVKGVTTRDGQVNTTYYIYNRAGQLLHELDSETGETRDHIQLNGRTIATVGLHNFVDSDNDGMPDYFERRHGLDVKTNDALLDDDNDGISNLVEYLYDHLPTDADTDNDGIPDGQDSELPSVIPQPVQPGGIDLTPLYQYLLE